MHPQDDPPDQPPINRWHSRGYLPHFDGDEAIQHVTFHLADSLPKKALEQMEAAIKFVPHDKQNLERRKWMEAWIDAGHGACLLANPILAESVQNTLLYFDGKHYLLIAWVVMPNHVHVLFQPMNGWMMSKIVASWKKFSAREINDFLRLSAYCSEKPTPVWHREYWDRYMRNENHLQQAVNYIHENPVKAGLTASAEKWPWSSAATLGPPIS